MSNDIRKVLTLLEAVEVVTESAEDQIHNLMNSIREKGTTFRAALQHINAIDPQVWNNFEFKKFALKNILDKMTDAIEPARHRVPAFLYAADMFFHLKKHNCPWPELNIIQQKLDNFFKNYNFDQLDHRTVFDRYSSKFGGSISYSKSFGDVLGLWQELGFSKMMDEIRDELYDSVENSQINEAAPMGFFKTLATGAAAIFSDVALGKLDTGKAANRIYSNYLKYLGSIGKNATSGTVGDLYSFLAKTGSNQKAMMGGLRTGTGLPINTENDIKKYWDTIIRDKAKTTKTIMVYTQNAARLPEKDREPQDFAKQAQTGAASVDRITKSKAKEVKAAPAAAVPAPANDIETAIKTTIGTQDARKQASSIDAALKALGV